ncbi:hypothetical protein V5P93_002948 [Actinokineospora auranticolor]|uniref:HAF family extracellular repeat protein n=1 Tax=Actinokineospora auranticolor TaxID=155976 RepID=A0A2S6H0T8_9PSEU|nr:hypothetical protein [Actinokineospora auranticolor]PPK71088.1 hypothetical protein CLV40_101274 [Actinokineospora auranticolor]
MLLRKGMVCTAVGLLLSVSIPAVAAGAEARGFTVVALETPGSVSRVTGLNDSDMAVGVLIPDEYPWDTIPVRWGRDGGLTRLTLPEDADAGYAYGINNEGTCAGMVYSEATLVQRPARWDLDGRVTELPGAPGFPETAAMRVTDSGWVGGFATNDRLPAHPWHAVRWDPAGGIEVLEPLPGDEHSSVTGLTDDGVAYGFSARKRATGAPSAAVRWGPDGTPTALPVPSWATGSELRGLRGRFAYGSVGLPNGRSAAVRWNLREDATTVTVLEPEGFEWPYVWGVNARGETLGSGQGLEDRHQKAFRWNRSGKPTELAPLPGDDWATANAINGSGAAVGTSTNPDRTETRTVRWSPSGRIAELPLLPGTGYESPEYTNERGSAAGQAYSTTEPHSRGVLWVATDD